MSKRYFNAQSRIIDLDSITGTVIAAGSISENKIAGVIIPVNHIDIDVSCESIEVAIGLLELLCDAMNVRNADREAKNIKKAAETTVGWGKAWLPSEPSIVPLGNGNTAVCSKSGWTSKP